MTLAFEKDERNAFVDTVLESHPRDWTGLDHTIDARDEMLEFAIESLDGDRDLALANYFINGLELLDVTRWCAGTHFGDGVQIPAALDFASGYGRLTRFLVQCGLARNLDVCDMLGDAMDFQESQFGVRGIRSAVEPEALVLDRQYDLITAASLFTHLPASTFQPWLERLTRSLAPGGMLLFSVHEQSLVNLELSEGIHFVPSSESKLLDPETYGSTWVSDRYVRQCLADIDPELRCARLPRAICGFQDLYVAGRTIDVIRIEQREQILGFFENCLARTTSVTLAGWATESSAPVERVELLLDGRVVCSFREFGDREDVARAIGNAGAKASGWAFELPTSSIRSFHDQVISIVAIGRKGARRTLFIGTIAAAVTTAMQLAITRLLEFPSSLEDTVESLRSQSKGSRVVAEALAARLNELTSTIESMQASRFWKARDLWFRIKRAVGLTNER